jgi:hypothetical protein
LCWREKKKSITGGRHSFIFSPIVILALFQILLFPPLASSFAPLLCDENLKKFNSWEKKLSENKCETREGWPLLTIET